MFHGECFTAIQRATIRPAPFAPTVAAVTGPNLAQSDIAPARRRGSSEIPRTPFSTAFSGNGKDTARCANGSYSFMHRRGTCSHHGGVSAWLP